jgi:hypothetical protein
VAHVTKARQASPNVTKFTLAGRSLQCRPPRLEIEWAETTDKAADLITRLREGALPHSRCGAYGASTSLFQGSRMIVVQGGCSMAGSRSCRANQFAPCDDGRFVT